MSTKNKDTYTDDSSDSSDDSDYFPSESENETKKVKVLNRPSKIGKKDTSDKTNKKRKLNPPPKSGGEPKIIRIVGTGNGEPPPPELEEIMNGFFQGIGDIMNPTSELKQKVLDSHLPKDIKDKCLDRLKHSYSEKTGELISNIMKIPFGKFASIPVKSTSKQEKIEEFFEKAIKTLDDCTYGMEKPKEEIINYIAQFIATNNKSSPRVLALQGLPGCGKTLLIKNGFAKSLQRPMSFISMGGSRDIHSFSGHSFTYVGSKYGRIIQSLIETKVMNPIIFMDELDKISLTPEGEEIQNLLIHLTDPVQNMNFEDKYFPDITFDLSKVIFIFSYNNENLINPILKDRLHIIKVPEPTEKDKVIIGKKYIIKEISSNIGFKQEDLIFEEDVIKHIIRMYTSDPGLRGLKRSIETIMLKLNASRYLGKFQKYKCFKNILISLPFKITIDMVDELLKNENNSKEEYFKSLFI
jgi:ATP-dependent Lon protease